MIRRVLVVAALGATAACTPRVNPADPSWIEHEHTTTNTPLGQSHADPSSAPDDPTSVPLDPNRAIDVAHPDALTEADAATALAQLGDRAPAAAVALRAARLAHHRGGDTEARAYLARAAGAADEPAQRAALTALAAQLAPAIPVAPALVAVVLPLSGRYAAIGAELRAAVELTAPRGAKLVYLDTRGEPDGATAAVDAAARQGAIAILGPVGERESLAAARAAMLRGIPIALLAPGDGADPHAGVFRFADSPVDEARAVARMAAAEHFPTVAVLAPRDDVAGEQAAAFALEAQRLGMQVAASGSYDPTGGDVEPDVKTFLNLVPATNPELREFLAGGRKRKLTDFTPEVGFSLLYIPDRYDRAAIVAAFLPYYNVELRTQDDLDPHALQKKHAGKIPQVVQLVGGGAWHHPSLALRGGPALQGAFVGDFFAPEAGDETALAFAAAFQQRTKRPPSTAAAEAYDAATMLLAARAAAPLATAPDPRGAMRAAMALARLDDGACGAARMGADGEVERDPSFLEVSGDQLVPIP